MRRFVRRDEMPRFGRRDETSRLAVREVIVLDITRNSRVLHKRYKKNKRERGTMKESREQISTLVLTNVASW